MLWFADDQGEGTRRGKHDVRTDEALVASTSAEAVQTIVNKAEEMRLTPQELMQIDSFFAPKGCLKPTNKDETQKVETFFREKRGHQVWCLICSKIADWNHDTMSRVHNTRTEELAAMNELAGWAGSLRRFSSTPGLVGELTQKNFRAFWGEQIDNMPRLAFDKLMKGASINVRLSTKRVRSVTRSNIKSFGMAAVSYPGQGRYSEREVAVRWEDLRESVPPPQPPAGSGWWPAVIVHWDELPSDSGLASWADYSAQVAVGTHVVWVMCWYQLVDGEWVLTAWPIRLLRSSL